MIELSKERVAQMLHEETMKNEDLPTILRAIYHRYMRLYEGYFADMDALNDEKIAEFRKYHEETKSLLKYYYMDIPMDVCGDLHEFEENYTKKFLGPDWHAYLTGLYKEFAEKLENWNKSEECLKAEFKEQITEAFYDAMGYVFRDGFNTNSNTAEKVIGGLKGLFFGKS